MNRSLGRISIGRFLPRISACRNFHASSSRHIQIGDSVPRVPLHKDSPANKEDLHKLTNTGKTLIVGVPGAFSPGCSQRHVPEFLADSKKLQAKGIKHLYVVAVNDAFVTGAWSKTLLGGSESKSEFVTFLGDPEGAFGKEWGTLFDATAIFGNYRSKRFAALIEDGKVKHVFVEPDNTGIDVSSAKHVLANI